MAASSSSTVSTNQTEIVPSKNVLVQVITLRLTKENYFPWSAAMTMGIVGRSRIAYIDGRNPEPAKTSGVWDTWFLEDNQVKTWIVNSVSADIQPLILRKKTARDMWVILEQMYGQKKTVIRTYHIMKTVYGLQQGNSSVADYYGALKAKWDELDYHSDVPWHCPQDQALYVAKEWENRVFLFLAGLNDEFEGVRSQILNSGEVSSIEDIPTHPLTDISSNQKGLQKDENCFFVCAAVGVLPPPSPDLRRRQICAAAAICSASSAAASSIAVVARSAPSPDLCRSRHLLRRRRRQFCRRLFCLFCRRLFCLFHRRRRRGWFLAFRRRLEHRGIALGCAPSPRVSCRLLSFAAAFGASSLVLVMAEEIAPKTDVAVDASVAPKSENLPVQVTSIRLTKDNYLSWSAALEIGITSRGRLSYITGAKPAPSKSDPQWENWALE
ncbi:hypothetical protein EJ110_NYTH56890, partial [Nymphaea thermarum]